MEVGTGWAGMKHIFSPGEEVVYAITAGGALLWYKHQGQATSTPAWGDGGKNISDGWGNMRLVCAAGDGVIFAVHQNGDFYRYRHTGWQTGAKTWTRHSSYLPGQPNSRLEFLKRKKPGLHASGAGRAPRTFACLTIGEAGCRLRRGA